MTDKWACSVGDFHACSTKNKEPSSHLPSKINTTSNELCPVCVYLVALLSCKWCVVLSCLVVTRA